MGLRLSDWANCGATGWGGGADGKRVSSLFHLAMLGRMMTKSQATYGTFQRILVPHDTGRSQVPYHYKN